VLNGNHETMNAAGNFRYATRGADVEMARWARWQEVGARLKAVCNCSDGLPTLAQLRSAAAAMHVPLSHAGGQGNALRTAALSPGGPVAARFFAAHPTVLQVGSTLFVHGGVLPAHAELGLERINAEARAWLQGAAPGGQAPAFLRGSNAVVWARDYSHTDERACNCGRLEQALGALPGAARQVVGHTIQDGVNGACGGRVFRVDVGLSKGCADGPVEALEILDDRVVRRLAEGAAPQVLSGGESSESRDSRAAAAPPAERPGGAAAGGGDGELRRRRAVFG
jgi:hypothetical protein